MNIDQAREIVEMLDCTGNYDSSVYENYSGRGMYGDTCIGIVTNASPILVGYYAAKLENDLEMEDDQLPIRSDNMGKDIIYY
jgi:hypothetical protein